MSRIVPLFAALAALSACSGYEDDEPVQPVSQSEAEALDDAAEMIDQRRLPDGVLDPEDHDTGAEDAGLTYNEPGDPQALEEGASE